MVPARKRQAVKGTEADQVAGAEQWPNPASCHVDFSRPLPHMLSVYVASPKSDSPSPGSTEMSLPGGWQAGGQAELPVVPAEVLQTRICVFFQ